MHISTDQFIIDYIVGTIGGIAVFLHADRNGSRHPTIWAICAFLLPLTVLVYAVHVARLRRGRRW